MDFFNRATHQDTHGIWSTNDRKYAYVLASFQTWPYTDICNIIMSKNDQSAHSLILHQPGASCFHWALVWAHSRLCARKDQTAN